MSEFEQSDLEGMLLSVIFFNYCFTSNMLVLHDSIGIMVLVF